jgi:predicted RNA binding protein YcfA (HicA-like mRNA interferase family)
LLKKCASLGCRKVRQKGSHVLVQCPCGRHNTSIPCHTGEDLGPGLLRAIERDLESCLGKGWVRK